VRFLRGALVGRVELSLNELEVLKMNEHTNTKLVGIFDIFTSDLSILTS